MDPGYLLADELEYELDLRQIKDADLEKLRLRLEDEEAGKIEKPMDKQRFTRLTVSEEIRECEKKLKDIAETVRVTEIIEDDNLATAAQSRLIHLAGRVSRLQAYAPTHTQVKILMDKIMSLGRETSDAREYNVNGAQALAHPRDKQYEVASHVNTANESPTQSATGTIPKTTHSIQHTSTVEQQSIQRSAKPGLKHIFGSIADLITGGNIEQPQIRNLDPRDTSERQFLFNNMNPITTNKSKKGSDVQYGDANLQPQANQRALQAKQPWTWRQQVNDALNDSFEPLVHRNSCSQFASRRNAQQNESHQSIDTRATSMRQEANGVAGGHRIRQWALRFSGLPGGIEVEDFIFRLERQATLNGVSHAALAIGIGDLLTDRAAVWYWTYQRKTECEDWIELKRALIRRYAPRQESDFEIRAKIERRKQQYNERFGDFCQDVEALAVRLSRQIEDEELIEILRRNMKIELRKALCYRTIHSIDDLIRYCDQFEELCEEEEREQRYISRRPAKVAEVEYSGYQQLRQVEPNHQYIEEREQEQHLNQTVEEVHSVKPRNEYMICWNCKELGHLFTQCERQQLSVFCFSCGMSGIMRPQCPKCTGNGWKDARTAGAARPNFQVPPPQILKRSTAGQPPINPFTGPKPPQN